MSISHIRSRAWYKCVEISCQIKTLISCNKFNSTLKKLVKITVSLIMIKIKHCSKRRDEFEEYRAKANIEVQALSKYK